MLRVMAPTPGPGGKGVTGDGCGMLAVRWRSPSAVASLERCAALRWPAAWTWTCGDALPGAGLCAGLPDLPALPGWWGRRSAPMSQSAYKYA